MSQTQESDFSDLFSTWLKGRLLVHTSSVTSVVLDSLSVSIVSSSKLPAFPPSVDVIAIAPDAYFYKKNVTNSPRETENLKNLEASYPGVTLASVDRFSDSAVSPTMPMTSDASYHLHVSRMFLSQHGFKDGDIVWFRSSRCFPLTAVYLEHVDEGEPLTEALCGKFVQHLRHQCEGTLMIVKQDAQFRYDLSEERNNYLHLSIGNMMSKMKLNQKQTVPDHILTFNVLMASPFLQGQITMDTEIYVIPSLSSHTPSSPSPVGDVESTYRQRLVSGSYHLQSGLQRPILSPSPEADEHLHKKLLTVTEPSVSPLKCLPHSLAIGNPKSTPRVLDPLATALTPPVEAVLSSSNHSNDSHFFGESSSYALEVQPFYNDTLDKNMILIPKTFELTLSSWLGPLSSADYVAIYPADNTGRKNMHFAEQNDPSDPFKGPVVPYYAVVKFFSNTDYYSMDSMGSIPSVKSGSLPTLASGSYPVVSNLEMPVAFLHPESLFSIFPHPRPPWDDSPRYISLELIDAGDIPCITNVTISLISEDIQKCPISMISKPAVSYLTDPRCVCLGEVFSLKCDNCRVFLKVTQLSTRAKKGVTKEVSFGTTMARTEISYSTKSVYSFIPNMSYLSKFGYVHGIQHYWDSEVPLGLEEPFHRLLAYCLPILEKGVYDAGITNNGILVSGPPGCGKMTVIKAVAKYCSMKVAEFNCSEMLLEMPSQMPFILSGFFRAALEHVPCIIVLRQLDRLGKDREGTGDNPKPTAHFAGLLDSLGSIPVLRDYPMIVMATTSNPNSVATKLTSHFLHEVHMSTPSQGDCERMLSGLCNKTSVAKDVDYQLIAQKSSGLMLSDFVSIITQATHEAKDDALEYLFNSKNPTLNWDLEQDIAMAGIVVSEAHILRVLENHLSAQGDGPGTFKIPSVKWDDVGGLQEAKKEILDTIQLPLEHPEMFGSTIVRSGILLYGTPGTGKTLLAKAVATECSMNFISVKGPELLDMYVGQSESNIRDIFKRAGLSSPCVMFFDELDSLAPNRGKSSDSGGVMDRVVSQLLAELDSLHDDSNLVFVIGATNRPDLIDPALLRPGRFDRLVYLEVSNHPESRMKVLQAVTRKMNLVDVDLWDVASCCPDNVTGADISALCNRALMLAVQRKVQYMETYNLTDDDWGDERQLEVTGEDFSEALRTTVPSVSAEEISKYRQLSQFRREKSFCVTSEENQE